MNSEQSDIVNIAGIKLAAQEILNIIALNQNCSSGILVVNNNLDIVVTKLFNCSINDVSLSMVIDEVHPAHAAGIIAFDIANSNAFISNAALNKKLKLICEAIDIELIDLILIKDNTWISLRQHNRL